MTDADFFPFQPDQNLCLRFPEFDFDTLMSYSSSRSRRDDVSGLANEFGLLKIYCPDRHFWLQPSCFHNSRLKFDLTSLDHDPSR